jgi:hypothetical protein
MDSWKNILAKEDQTLMLEPVSIVEATKPLHHTEVMDIPIKNGEGLTVNFIVADVTTESKQLQRNNGERTLIDSNTKEHIAEFQKYLKKEQAIVLGVQIIYLMALANKHISIIKIMNIMMINLLKIPSKSVVVVTQKKPKGFLE